MEKTAETREAWVHWGEVKPGRAHINDCLLPAGLPESRRVEALRDFLEELPPRIKLVTVYPAFIDREDGADSELPLYEGLGFQRLGFDGIGMVMGRLVNDGPQELLLRVPEAPRNCELVWRSAHPSAAASLSKE